MTDPKLYFFLGGPWDGQPVLVDGIPVGELEVKPSRIQAGWESTGAYVWDPKADEYVWTEEPQ